jgi:hypothetical protein
LAAGFPAVAHYFRLISVGLDIGSPEAVARPGSRGTLTFKEA